MFDALHNTLNTLLLKSRPKAFFAGEQAKGKRDFRLKVPFLLLNPPEKKKNSDRLLPETVTRQLRCKQNMVVDTNISSEIIMEWFFHW